MEVILTINGFGHCGGVGYRDKADGVVRRFGCGAPHKLIVRLVLQLPVAEGDEYGVEFQTFGFMDGKDADAVHLPAGDGFAAQRFVPIADKAVQFGRVALQVFGHCIEEREEVGVLLFDAAHAEEAEQFFQQFVEGH